MFRRCNYADNNNYRAVLVLLKTKCGGKALLLLALGILFPEKQVSSYSPPSNVSGTTYYSVVLDPNVVSCNNTSASVAVIINPLPTASITGNNGPVCSGDDATFNLTGTANARVTYTINSGSNQTISLNGSGTATIYEYDVTSDQTLDLVSVENTATGCSQNVPGSSTVTVTPDKYHLALFRNRANRGLC